MTHGMDCCFSLVFIVNFGSHFCESVNHCIFQSSSRGFPRFLISIADATCVRVLTILMQEPDLVSYGCSALKGPALVSHQLY